MRIKHLIFTLTSITIAITALFLFFYQKNNSLFDQLPVLALGRDIDEVEILFTFGNSDSSNLKKPIDIALDSKGNSYVVDSANKEMKVYDPKGKFLYAFGKGGDSEKSLIAPASVTIYDKLVLVSEPTAGRIQAFSLKGKFIRTFFASSQDEKISPVGMVKIDKHLLFTDVARHRIVEIDLNGKVISTFGSPGTKNGEFAYPQDIAIDENEQIYVSDSNNGRVQIFDRKGKYLSTIDGTKDEKEKMSLPRGIAIDSLNRLIVVDTIANQLRFFELNGEPMFVYGDHGQEDGQLNFPNGVVMTSNKMYVTDRENNRIQVFEIK